MRIVPVTPTTALNGASDAQGSRESATNELGHQLTFTAQNTATFGATIARAPAVASLRAACMGLAFVSLAAGCNRRFSGSITKLGRGRDRA
jgi:hypothetical protein